MRQAFACVLVSSLGMGGGCATASEEVDEFGAVDTTMARYYIQVATEQGIDGRGESFSRATFTYADFEASELPRVTHANGCTIVDKRRFDGYPLWPKTAGDIAIFSEHHGTVVMKPQTKEPGLFLVRGLPLYAARLPAWDPGEELALVAGGDDLPEFRAALRVPQPVQVVGSGVRAAHQHVALDVRRDLQINWEPSENQEVGIHLVQYRHARRPWVEYSIECFFPGAAGTGVIGADVLAGLATHDTTMDGTSRTELFTAGQSSSRIKTGPYEIFVVHRASQGYAIDVQ